MYLKEVFIVGGGSSLTGFDFSKLKGHHTIVVNKSIFDVPQANYFITIDYTFLRKIDLVKFNQIDTAKVFVINFANNYIKEVSGRIIDTRWNLPYDLKPFDVIIKSRSINGFGNTFGDFRNGCNSGFCALQLAILLRYTKINLLGFDLTINQEKIHYHTGYSGTTKSQFVSKLDEYYKFFEGGLIQLKEQNSEIKVVSCSPISRLNSIIDYVPIEKIL
jgi:hypothetical protein